MLDTKESSHNVAVVSASQIGAEVVPLFLGKKNLDYNEDSGKGVGCLLQSFFPWLREGDKGCMTFLEQ